MSPNSLNARRWLWAAIDVSIVVIATFAGALLRYDFQTRYAFAPPVLALAATASVAQLVIGTLFGPYAVGHMRGSYEEIVDVGRTVLFWSIPLAAVSVLGPWDLGARTLPAIMAALAMLGMFGARFLLRAATSRPGDRNADEAHSVLVLGAGSGGRQLVRSLVRDPGSHMVPVGFIDDDPKKRRLRIDGVRVLGKRDDIIRVAEETGATILAIAVPSASPELLQDLQAKGRAAGLGLLVLPPTRDILGKPGASDLRSLDLSDLLGRRPIELDHSAIAESIQGRTVLVTGAGGSIGSELCRQIAKFGPSKLLLLDRDESALHATQISITGKGLLDDDTTVLADIRDQERMFEVFEQARPDVVFHAAALKHLPLLERFPEEAWKTNVLGTLNVLSAAQASGVSTFVNVSTDKAANPSCILGYSKRITERLTADFARQAEGTFVSVRFGNVLGSRGSVITAFTAQIEQGGPVTVTHPDVERYFMLIPEACQLVLQSAAIGRDGEVMVLDMGEPAKIEEVARTLIDLSGRNDVEIIYTGLRPGEKLSEELFTPGEDIKSTKHHLVASVDVPLMDADWVRRVQHRSADASATWMRTAATPGRDVEAPREDATHGI